MRDSPETPPPAGNGPSSNSAVSVVCGREAAASLRPSYEKVPWRIWDIVFVHLVGFVLFIVPLLFSRKLVDQGTVQYSIFIIYNYCVGFALPYLRMNKRYHVGFAALGMRKGNTSVKEQVLTGLLISFVLIVLVGIVPFWRDMRLIWHAQLHKPFASLVGFQLVLHLVLRFMALPIELEIYDRGLIAAYIRKRCRIIVAVFIQAAIHTLFMTGSTVKIYYADGAAAAYLIFVFLFQLSLGALFYRFDGLIAPICCNAVVNFSFFPDYY